MTNLWQQYDGKKYSTSLDETAWRIVESQGYASTRKLVDSLDEQTLLEQMIDDAKPKIARDCKHLHPLLSTPFRYPPLRHGSRFGHAHERSIWYGSLQLKSAMAELTFYRLNFLNASAATYGMVITQLTSFSTSIKTRSAIQLIDKPFSAFTNEISSPIDYSVSQSLGTAMRHDGVKAFNYQSARDPDAGINVGVFCPTAFASKQPHSHSFQSWQCIADHRTVELTLTSAVETEIVRFSIDMFMVNGALPFPGA